jgi:8-oxo-dGTP pyrophosphatase MutT (NUDIX family)
MPQLKSCGFLVVRGDPIDSFLLLVHPTRYDLPKGHMEPGESELECALRELKEETGIAAHEIDIDPAFRFSTSYEVPLKRHPHLRCPKTTVIFLARLRADAAIRATEHVGFQWHRWNPPHAIQPETIDPLLRQVESHLTRD